jgi:hypothetical protein
LNPILIYFKKMFLIIINQSINNFREMQNLDLIKIKIIFSKNSQKF